MGVRAGRCTARSPPESIEAAVRRILRIPSLPPQLPPDALDRIPEAPGVYRFFGDNPLPIYIGKSINLRERVAAHFTGDWRSETDLRLSQEIRRIEFEETAGELGALLREAVLVKTQLPAHNRALRRKEEAGVLVLDERRAALRPRGRGRARCAAPAATVRSRPSAARARRCARSPRSTRFAGAGSSSRGASDGPCFQRQLKRCAGACVGAESPHAHDARLAAALAPLAIPALAAAGRGARPRSRHAVRERVDVHVIARLVLARHGPRRRRARALLEAPPRRAFDIDVARLLHRRWAKGALRLTPVPAAAPPCRLITTA